MIKIETVKVNALPICRRGAFAVWAVVDIPVGVRRGALDYDVSRAFENACVVIRQTEHDQRLACDRRDRGLTSQVAAVCWGDLQPLHDVPRGRESMSAAQWGATRDANGTCLVCAADDSMWCDTVAHAQAERPIVGSSVAITPSNHPHDGARPERGTVAT